MVKSMTIKAREMEKGGESTVKLQNIVRKMSVLSEKIGEKESPVVKTKVEKIMEKINKTERKIRIIEESLKNLKKLEDEPDIKEQIKDIEKIKQEYIVKTEEKLEETINELVDINEQSTVLFGEIVELVDKAENIEKEIGEIENELKGINKDINVIEEKIKESEDMYYDIKEILEDDNKLEEFIKMRKIDNYIYENKSVLDIEKVKEDFEKALEILDLEIDMYKDSKEKIKEMNEKKEKAEIIENAIEEKIKKISELLGFEIKDFSMDNEEIIELMGYVKELNEKISEIRDKDISL